MAVPIVQTKSRPRKIIPRRLKIRPKAAICIIPVDGPEQLLTPVNISNPQTREQVAKGLAAATVVVTNLIALLTWTAQDRTLAISFLVRSNCTAFHPREKSEVTSTSLIEVLTKCCPVRADGPAYEQWLRPCLEAIALGSELQTEPACAQLSAAVKDKGLSVSIASFRKMVGEVRKGLRLDTTSRGQGLLAESVTNLPASASANLLVPRGWTMSDTGVYRPGAVGAFQVVPVPLFLSELHRNVGNGSHYVTVTWLRNGGWVERTVPRTMIANKQTIVGLAEYGAPVNSDNAGTVVKFLADFEHANSAVLAETLVSSQLGWQGANGQHGFLLGREHIVVSSSGPENIPASKIVFRGSDHGDDQVAGCFRGKGRIQAWTVAMHRLRNYPRIMLGLYAGFVPPLLDIVGAPNVTFDFAGETTIGKTFAMRVTASSWGCVEINDPLSVVKSFNGTVVWLERQQAVIRDLATFLDDTKNAPRKEQIGQLIYSNSQGRGKGRGSKEGLQEQQAWRTALFLTGEESATSYSRDGGSRPRTITIWGSPFGQRSEEIADLIRRTNDILRDNYGTAGNQYVQYLVQNRATLQASWRERYDQLVKKYENKAAKNHFARRQAPNFAAIVLAAELAHRALKLLWKFCNPIDLLWEELTREVSGADQAAEALRVAMDWANSHQARFSGRTKGNEVPAAGWLGRWDKADVFGWKWIGFLREPLTTFLDSRGFAGATMIQTWYDRGWLHVTKDGKKRRTFRALVDKESCWLIAVARQAVERVGKDSHT